MRFVLRSLVACAVLGLASAAFAQQIDNPEYAQWSKYKAGTFVAIKQTTEMPGMAEMAAMMPQMSITTKLTEVKPDALTLELTTATTAMGQTRETKTTRKVPAKIENVATTTPTATAPATPATAEIKDLKEGKDTVEVKGVKLETATREFTTTATPGAIMGGMGGGPAAGGAGEKPTVAHMKTWTSPEVPAGMVKTQVTTTVEQMGEIKMTMTVVDYAVVK